MLKQRYLLQFGGKLCIWIVRGEMSVSLGGKMGQICGPTEDLICRVLHQAPEHLPDPEVCVSGEQTWCSGQPRCTASCIPVNVWPRLLLVCAGSSLTPSCVVTSRSRGHEKPPSSCSTAGSLLFLANMGRASREGITKHLSSGASQGTPQTLSH